MNDTPERHDCPRCHCTIIVEGEGEEINGLPEGVNKCVSCNHEWELVH